MKTVAIILAAGQGSRMGTDIPKQFLTLGDKTILEHSIEAFERHSMVDEIGVVVQQEYISRVATMVQQRQYSKVRHIIVGGEERYKSSLAAIEQYAGDDCNLLLHDAARPFVAAETITACVVALRSCEAVCVAVPTTDTVLELSEEGTIARIPPRRLLRNAQTPQGFRRSTLARAFVLAAHDPSFTPTDDCSVVQRYLPDVSIKVVRGSEENIKITYKSDLDSLKNIVPAR